MIALEVFASSLLMMDMCTLYDGPTYTHMFLYLSIFDPILSELERKIENIHDNISFEMKFKQGGVSVVVRRD